MATAGCRAISPARMRRVAPVFGATSTSVANIRSQIKRNLQNEKRRLRNKAVRSEMRTRTKRALSLAEAGGEESVDALRLAVKRIDKAAANGVIHKNQASNRKSRLMRRITALSTAKA